MRVIHLAFAALIFAIVCIAWGVGYWVAAGHGNGWRCLYGDPGCSLTAATWFLVLFGSLAFLAAFAAARFAADTYKMETRSALGQVPCPDRQHSPLQTIYVLETMEVLIGLEPPEFNPADYRDPEEHEFQNLGRSAIIQGAVSVEFKTATNKSPIVQVPLGNIPRDRGAHVRVYLSNKLDKVITRWCEPVTHVGKYKLVFYPFIPEVPEEVLPVQIAGGSIVLVDAQGRQMHFEYRPEVQGPQRTPDELYEEANRDNTHRA